MGRRVAHFSTILAACLCRDPGKQFNNSVNLGTTPAPSSNAAIETAGFDCVSLLVSRRSKWLVFDPLPPQTRLSKSNHTGLEIQEEEEQEPSPSKRRGCSI
jgi:hypothetical protein